MKMAFAKSFLQYDLVKKENLLLIEKSANRAESLRTENTGVVIETISAHIGEYDIVILSVKPQDFAAVQDDLREVLQPQQVVLSIMAGIPIS
jgi:pyrroline-5-carboxylate reductase